MCLKAEFHGAAAVFVACVRRQRDCRSVTTIGFGQSTNALDERVAIFSRHTDIEDQDVWMEVGKRGVDRRSGLQRQHLGSRPLN